MRTIIKRNQSSWIIAFFGLLFLSLSVFAMEPEGMKMDSKNGEMMQGEHMSADEMIKKGDEMIAQGKAMKKKGMMMKKDEMKDGEMMKENKMKENKMDEMKEMNK